MMTMVDSVYKPQLDVVAVEFYDRARTLMPQYRIQVTFRDGGTELVDVKPPMHHGVASIFAAAVTAAIDQRRTNILLEEQRQRLRAEWAAEQGG